MTMMMGVANPPIKLFDPNSSQSKPRTHRPVSGNSSRRGSLSINQRN